ncbi:MAG: L-lactate permease [Veillonellaceae bacterium]|nr:L-lactate permease [Veillonellaceae bacterium]
MDALFAAIPLIVFLIGLPVLMKPAVKVAPVAWLVTVLIAIFYFGFPAQVTLLAALQGAITGIFPIMYIPFGAIIVYNVLKATGWMDKMQNAMSSITIDRRAQALLIGYGFSAFLEGICGFGSPVAIPASILVGLGYDPLMAALVCLVANTGPVPFGSLAIPTDTLALTTQLDFMKLSQMTGRLMPIMAFIMTFATVFVMSGVKGMKGIMPAILITGLSFSIVEFLVANLLGATLASILGALVCLGVLGFYLYTRKETEVWLFPGESAAATGSAHTLNFKELGLSWLPYILLALLVIAVNLPGTKPIFAGKVAGTEWMLIKAQIYNPNKVYAFTWLQSPGTITIIAGLIAFQFMGIRFSDFTKQIGITFKQMVPAFITVACILSISEVMNLTLPIIDLKSKAVVWATASGAAQPSMIAVMSKSLVAAIDKEVMPFLSPAIGALGVFVTGSNTSANALFGNLQTLTAQGLGLSDVLMASAGNAGASAGKMISPQSIVIAATAVGLMGKEGVIMRKTIKFAIPYALFLGVLVYLYQFVFPGLIP